MIIKKITAAVLAAAILLSATACGTADPQQTTAAPETTAVTTAAAEESSSAAAESEETTAETAAEEPVSQTEALSEAESTSADAAEAVTTAETTAETTAATTEAATAATTEAATAAATEATTAATTAKTTAATTAKTTEATTAAETAGSSHKLSNPDADAVTQKVYDYLCDNFGKTMLSCQQESTWMGSPDYEMDYIEETTGKLPAMRGLDFMNGDFDGVVKRSKEWWAKGGLVTICWHTGVNGKGYQESLGDDPDFDKLLTKGTDEYNAMIANWDKAAKALTELKDAGIPVLWRPFHEFDGQWFWWGKDGGESFVKLWRMMYDYFTDEYGLTNLIWVLGYDGNVKNGWYVGDDYCDIIGADTYDNSTNSKAWKRLLRVSSAGKPMTFHECGNVPSVESFEKDGCIWSWFMIWHTDYIKGNDKENLKNVYNSDLVITLDELPSFS